jgi:hypothetical protein
MLPSAELPSETFLTQRTTAMAQAHPKEQEMEENHEYREQLRE